MDTRYSKIHNLTISPAKKLYNSSYLEELTGLIKKAASNLNDDTYYFLGGNFYLNETEIEPNNSYEEFIKDFKNEFMYSSSAEIKIIRGRAGTGKTLFFKKGIQRLVRDDKTYNDRYIPLGVDFSNIDSRQSIKFYEDFICKKLCEHALDAIRLLKDVDFNEFADEYEQLFSRKYDTRHELFYPIMYFCKEIYRQYSKPCLIIMDNVDLACDKTQSSIFKATVNIFKEFHDFMEQNGAKDKYCVFFAMRPETYLGRAEARMGTFIDFPLPNIQLICIETIKKVIEEIANKFDNDDSLKCEVTYYNITNNDDDEPETAKTFCDVANYFNAIFSHFLTDLWNNSDCKSRLGNTEEFHCNLVNYNVRKFLRFLADTLSNGGFDPLTIAFNKNQFGGHYNVYDYIEMLIRGRWEFHPGNNEIDGEGGNNSPIVFNFFDTSNWANVQQQQIKHFMIYIRILQYFLICTSNGSVKYGDLKNCLKQFFNEEYIKIATQQLTFIRILYSFDEGEENIASKRYYSEVKIDDDTKLSMTPTGKFYLEKFIPEFEYLYQMALSSLMPEKSVVELSDCWKTEKELVVFKFLEGIFYIIKKNLETYSYEGVLDSFKSIFCQESKNCCKPYRRMLDTFIIVLENKINRAKRYDLQSLSKLENILSKAKDLKEMSLNYFNLMIGDEL